MKAKTNLQKALLSDKFTVTCELTPPCGTDVKAIIKNAAALKKSVAAINVNDNPIASVRMSSLALSKLLVDSGIEPVFQMTLRDRNRIALQSDILGAYALGIRNVLCMSGDHPARGDHPQAQRVFDLDSIQWISAVNQITEKSTLINGKVISGDAEFFVGCVANPFVAAIELHVMTLAKKIAAGAQFVQTQPVLDMDLFKEWLNAAEKAGILKNCSILPGVIILKSAKMARQLKDRVRGFNIPDQIIKRMSSVSEEKQLAEGIKICTETIKELKKIKTLPGVHIMAIGCEDKISDVIKSAGL